MFMYSESTRLYKYSILLIHFILVSNKRLKKLTPEFFFYHKNTMLHIQEEMKVIKYNK